MQHTDAEGSFIEEKTKVKNDDDILFEGNTSSMSVN